MKFYNRLNGAKIQTIEILQRKKRVSVITDKGKFECDLVDLGVEVKVDGRLICQIVKPEIEGVS
jgi:RNase P/RNase MRP subunit p29